MSQDAEPPFDPVPPCDYEVSPGFRVRDGAVEAFECARCGQPAMQGLVSWPRSYRSAETYAPAA